MSCSTEQGRRRRTVGETRGDAGGIALIWGLGMTALLSLVWLGIQVGFTQYGQSVAEAAAQAGIRAAITAPGDPSRAEPAARAFIEQQAASDILDPQINVTVDGDTVTVTVSGFGVSVIPGTRWSVDGTASGPMEQMG